MFIHLAEQHSREGDFILPSEGDLREELKDSSCLCFFLLESCLITRLTRAWAQGVETNEGLPMWKWFPYRPARAFVLISRNELRLEKLSSGRRWGWDGAAAVAILPCNNCFSTETVDLLASRAPCIYWLKTARLKDLHWTWRWDFNSLVDRIPKTYCGNMHC